ncbi:MAG: glycosyltransferase [Planctomycetota bacterium]
MKIDIAICTFNRAELLQNTLNSIAACVKPSGCDVRIIVVNNNSTDRTSDVVNSLTGIDVKLVDEPQQGHTFARNKAIVEADGDLLIWTDDDVLVSTDWITGYAAAYRESNDAFWGGPIEPIFDPPAPEWINENMDVLSGCFARRELGDKPVRFSESLLPYGANFAIRTAIQKLFPFDVGLGRKGSNVTGEDELDLLRRVLSAGHKGGWLPGCRVRHVITAERQSEQFVHEYFAGQGRALVRKGEPWTTRKTRLKFQSLYESFAYRLKRGSAKSPAWVAHLIRSGLACGQLEALSESGN